MRPSHQQHDVHDELVDCEEHHRCHWVSRVVENVDVKHGLAVRGQVCQGTGQVDGGDGRRKGSMAKEHLGLPSSQSTLVHIFTFPKMATPPPRLNFPDAKLVVLLFMSFFLGAMLLSLHTWGLCCVPCQGWGSVWPHRHLTAWAIALIIFSPPHAATLAVRRH